MKKLLLAAIFICAPAVASAQVPAFPMAFWGAVTIDGAAAPSGTVVRAYYGPEIEGSVTAQESGVYGYTEPTKQKLVVGEGNGAITFTAQVPGGDETGGLVPVTHAQFASGETVQKDLAFSTQEENPPASEESSGDNPSRNRRSGGGGGSSPRSAETVEQGEVLGAETASSGLTEAQIQAVLQLLQAFGADQSIISSVTASLRGSGSASVAATSYVFARDLMAGSTGEDVRALQQLLNRKGFIVASSGPGSAGAESSFFGPATRAALAKFQAASGISPAIGYFGPATRAYANKSK